MTKEEILFNLDNGYIAQAEISDVVERHHALIAMEEYAKQEAIAFAEWYADDKQINNYNGETIEQLYKLYKQTIKIK